MSECSHRGHHRANDCAASSVPVQTGCLRLSAASVAWWYAKAGFLLRRLLDPARKVLDVTSNIVWGVRILIKK